MTGVVPLARHFDLVALVSCSLIVTACQELFGSEQSYRRPGFFLSPRALCADASL